MNMMISYQELVRTFLRLHAWRHPVLHLKRLGVSKACRRLVVTLMNHHPIALLNLDAAGDILPGIETFDW
ncbi:DUF5983 family protein [Serratia sp. IR-2025]